MRLDESATALAGTRSLARLILRAESVASPRDAPDRLGHEGVSFETRELPLQRREGLDEFGGLEGTVPPSDRHLLEDAGAYGACAHARLRRCEAEVDLLIV